MEPRLKRSKMILTSRIITRWRSWSFAEYCKHLARLNDVHAFGYNSAGSERIWMKLGELRAYCMELSLTDFGRDPRRSGSGSASRNLVFCPLNNALFHRLPVGKISRHLHKKTCFRVLCGALENNCKNLPVRGLFSQKNLHFCLIKVNDFRLQAAISRDLQEALLRRVLYCGHSTQYNHLVLFHFRRGFMLK